MWERAWKVLNGLVVAHSGLADPTFCCRKAWSFGLQFSQSQGIGRCIEPQPQCIVKCWQQRFGRLTEISPNLLRIEKARGLPCLTMFKQFLAAKAKNKFFVKPILNAHTLNKAFMDVVNYVQYNHFEAANDWLPISFSFLGQQFAPITVQPFSTFDDRGD